MPTSPTSSFKRHHLDSQQSRDSSFEVEIECDELQNDHTWNSVVTVMSMVSESEINGLRNNYAKSNKNDDKNDKSLKANGRNKSAHSHRRKSRFLTRHWEQKLVVYNLLQRPRGFVAIGYHFFVSAIVLACLVFTIVATVTGNDIICDHFVHVSHSSNNLNVTDLHE